jgi:hypothetical protein
MQELLKLFMPKFKQRVNFNTWIYAPYKKRLFMPRLKKKASFTILYTLSILEPPYF